MDRDSRTGPEAWMGSAARWSADICYAGPTASSSLVPASLQSSKKERQNQGSQVYVRAISYFLKSAWFLLDSLYPGRFLKHLSLKQGALTNSREPLLLRCQFSGATIRGAGVMPPRKGEGFTLICGNRVLEGGRSGGSGWSTPRDALVTGAGFASLPSPV